ncbi:MAG TPA: hypothetical protein VFN67_02340 [Polyangiales bacterium]|nr:hypothetical protein [Polyangiales bacterium]
MSGPAGGVVEAVSVVAIGQTFDVECVDPVAAAESGKPVSRRSGWQGASPARLARLGSNARTRGASSSNMRMNADVLVVCSAAGGGFGEL